MADSTLTRTRKACCVPAAGCAAPLHSVLTGAALLISCRNVPFASQLGRPWCAGLAVRRLGLRTSLLTWARSLEHLGAIAGLVTGLISLVSPGTGRPEDGGEAGGWPVCGAVRPHGVCR